MRRMYVYIGDTKRIDQSQFVKMINYHLRGIQNQITTKYKKVFQSIHLTWEGRNRFNVQAGPLTDCIEMLCKVEWSRLSTLFINFVYLGNRECKYLTQACLPQLKVLVLAKCHIQEGGVQHISKGSWKHLQCLCVRHVESSKGVFELTRANLPKIKFFSFSDIIPYQQLLWMCFPFLLVEWNLIEAVCLNQQGEWRKDGVIHYDEYYNYTWIKLLNKKYISDI